MKITTSIQMKTIENNAMKGLGISSAVLMENAAVGAAEICLEYLKDIKNPNVVVFCSKGNNGGDGFAVSRHLFIEGVNVNIVLYGDIDKATPDCLLNYNIAKNMGISVLCYSPDKTQSVKNMLKNSDLCIDALIGTGLKNALKPDLDDIAELINKNSRYTISVDIPTGINSDNGQRLSKAVRADETVSFHLAKAGHFLSDGAILSGKLSVVNIGIDHFGEYESNLKYNVLTKSEAKAILPERKKDAHKGNFGRVFDFAGSKDMTGAAVFNCMSAYAAGAGIVKLFSVKETCQALRCLLPEALTHTFDGENGYLSNKDIDDILRSELKRGNVFIVGSGMGVNNSSIGFLDKLIEYSQAPMVLDADALNILADNKKWFERLKGECIITPHIGEMSRLTGLSPKEISNDMITSAVEFSKEFGVVTILKSFRSVIAAPNGEVFINTTGSCAMAKGGSGDCLAGTVAAFAAQGLSSFKASVLGCYVNGYAGELAQEKLGDYSVKARDIIDNISMALKSIADS